MLDVEPSGELPPPSALERDLSKWLQTVQDSLAIRPLIYTARSLWDTKVEPGLAAEGYPYSGSGSVPGISTAVDLDRFNGGTPCTIP